MENTINNSIYFFIIKFISSKDDDEGRVMLPKSNNKEIKINGKAEEVKSRLNRYQSSLELSIRVSNFIFNCVNLLYY